MLKQHKNELLQILEGAGLDISDFVADDVSIGSNPQLPGFRIRFKPADLSFITCNAPDGSRLYKYSYTRYAPGFSTPPYSALSPEDDYCSFEEIKEEFVVWIAEEVRLAIDDALLPDLWTRATLNTMLVDSNKFNTSEFSDEERQQVKHALSSFCLLIEETFRPTHDQMVTISERIDYLKSAVDRLNRFDWLNVAIGIVSSIGVNLFFDKEEGRQLITLFQKAFSVVSHLLK